jgi:polyisoprenoid-binding protein YceI
MHEVIASGQVSIHGVSQPLTASAVIDAFETNSKKKVKISTQFKVTLNDFKIKGKEGLVGDKVGESIDIETVLKGIIL